MLALVQLGLGKAEGTGVAIFCESIDSQASGIAESIVLGNLVKGFTDRIIYRGSKHFDAIEIFHPRDD